MKRKTNLMGFTLLEVLIAAALSTMVLIAVYTVIKPTQKMCNTTNTQAEQNSLCSQLSYAITEKIKFTTDLIIIKNASGYPQDTSGSFNKYAVICFKNYDTSYSYDTKDEKGRVMLKNLISDTSDHQLLGDGSYGDYSLNYIIGASGCDFDLTTTCYKIRKDESIVDTFEYKKSIRLLNYELKSKNILVVDMANTPSIPTGLSVPGVGKNTYLVYKLD